MIEKVFCFHLAQPSPACPKTPAPTPDSPDGKTLLSSGLDRTIRWWDMATGQEMLLIPEAILASGTEYRFRESYFAGQAEFVAADKWLVWRESQGPIRVTALPSLQEIDAIEKSRDPLQPR